MAERKANTGKTPDIRASTTPFVAVDVETLDERPESVCCLALVRVENQVVVARATELVRPERLEGRFSSLHGISAEQLRHARAFAEVWGSLERMIEGVHHLVAHNAAFDRAVLEASWRAATVRAPRVSWVCTLRLARRLWTHRPAALPDVCRRLGIPLAHHEPLSDAEACARVLLAARSR